MFTIGLIVGIGILLFYPTECKGNHPHYISKRSTRWCYRPRQERGRYPSNEHWFLETDKDRYYCRFVWGKWHTHTQSGYESPLYNTHEEAMDNNPE